MFSPQAARDGAEIEAKVPTLLLVFWVFQSHPCRTRKNWVGSAAKVFGPLLFCSYLKLQNSVESDFQLVSILRGNDKRKP